MEKDTKTNIENYKLSNTKDELRCSERVGRSCSDSGNLELLLRKKLDCDCDIYIFIYMW
jgi:hypothetical protein